MFCFLFKHIFNKQTNGLMGYMDSGALPFDINDFVSNSPKSGDAQHMHSLMMDTYTAVPQPVPPVATSSSSPSSAASNYMNYAGLYSQQSSIPFDQYNQSMQQPPPYNAAIRPVPPPNIFQGGNPYNTSQSQNPYASANAFNNSMAQPPPMPPSFNNNDANITDEYNPDSWEIDMSWNTTQDSSFNQSLDGPHSPPHYERKGTSNVIEYIDPSVDEGHLAGAGDVDHRQLILPNINGLSAIGAKDRGRLVDVDHRNLISLTGSPKLSEKETSSQSTSAANESSLWNKDMDLRQMANTNVSSNAAESRDYRQSPTTSLGDSKLVPPPSPPAMLLAQSAGVDASDTVNAMNPPLLPPPRFQSPPLSKMKIGKCNEPTITQFHFRTFSFTILFFLSPQYKIVPRPKVKMDVTIMKVLIWKCPMKISMRCQNSKVRKAYKSCRYIFFSSLMICLFSFH